jgi:hypothetical protein
MFIRVDYPLSFGEEVWKYDNYKAIYMCVETGRPPLHNLLGDMHNLLGEKYLACVWYNAFAVTCSYCWKYYHYFVLRIINIAKQWCIR